jgi:hypothetical protein
MTLFPRAIAVKMSEWPIGGESDFPILVMGHPELAKDLARRGSTLVAADGTVHARSFRAKALQDDAGFYGHRAAHL